MGRPKGHSPRYRNLAAFYALAHETLADGQLVLSVPRVAFALDCSRKTVETLIREGDLPAFAVPVLMDTRVIYENKIPCEELLAWISRHTQPHPVQHL